MAAQIHWHEGLHMQAHHLQQSQKLLFDSIASERQLSLAYPYGAIEVRLKPGELENLNVQLARLRVIMPGGVEVDFPEDAELDPLDVKKSFEKLEDELGSFVVYLAVPRWQEARANTIGLNRMDGGSANILYRVHEVECADENTGRSKKPILKRRVNARLILDGDDQLGMEVMPLLRISKTFGRDGGMASHSFICPALTLKGAPALLEMTKDLAFLLQMSRTEVVKQMHRKGQRVDLMRTEDFERVLGLRVLNRFAARLPAILKAPNVTTFAVYLELREMLAELAVLRLDQDLFDAPAYDHDNPLPVFAELHRSIAALLPGGVSPKYFRIPFQAGADKYTLELEEHHFTQTREFYLGVRSDQPLETVVQLVQNGKRFKLVPRRQEDHMDAIPLKEEPDGPPNLPKVAGLRYFQILWNKAPDAPKAEDEFRKERAASVISPEAFEAGFEISMYMTLTPEAQRQWSLLRSLTAG